MNKKRYTLKDIAELAEVSRGTVDRVINNRGMVSVSARQKVENVLDKIEYRPNILAQSLKGHRTNTIAIVFPNYQKEPYWKQCFEGIKKAELEMSQFGISCSFYFYVPEKEDYEESFSRALKNKPNAILAVPMEFQNSIDFIKEAKIQKIPLVLLNSSLKGDGTTTFLGQDYFKSGRTAAQLMSSLIQPAENKNVLIIHFGRKSENTSHLFEKEKGFIQYFKDKNIEVAVNIINFEKSINLATLQKILINVHGVYITTSKSYLIAEHLKHYKELKVIGYDLIPENIAYLKEGTIDVLLHQNPKKQGNKGVLFLSDHLIYKKPMQTLKLFPIDIIIKENVESFIKEDN